MADERPQYTLFTDGACSGNPGPGGWAFVLRGPDGTETVEYGAEARTTNNRMEMMSVIEGLKTLSEPARVRLVSDSKYVGDGISSWMPNWKRNGWRRKVGKGWGEVKNVELWQQMDELVTKHQVTTEWIRGHAGHPENERCDELAVQAYRELQRNGRRSR